SQVFYSLLLVPTWLWLLARARSVIIGAGTVVVAVPLCQVQEGHWTFVAVALTWVALVLESRAASVAVSAPFEGEEAGQDAEVGVAA
ncbi:MAG TPA: hypothetical protein VLC09_08140, partial [Polyangiaceae bacterium]|nr:hypothetical protein [Polyangiaceae bacterium]